MQLHCKLFSSCLYKINERAVITVFVKNLLSAVTSIDKVIAGVVG
jgi:hypothetical protein